MKSSMTMESPVSQPRLWGGLALAGAISYAALGVILTAAQGEAGPTTELLSVLWALGCVGGLIGMAQLGVAGRHLFGRIALAIAVVAYALAAVDALMLALGVYDMMSSPLFAISRLGTLVGMLLVGIAVLLTHRWRGWRRFAPFALLLSLPLSMLLSMVAGQDLSMPVSVALAWLIIGYAIWSSPVE